MGAARVTGYEPERGDEEDGGKGGGVRSQADKTEDKTGGKYFPEWFFCLESASRLFQRPLLYKRYTKTAPYKDITH